MVAELLHGLTFALFHHAAMRVTGADVPRHLMAAAQALYSAASRQQRAAYAGIRLACFDTWLEGRAFFAMAILCAAAMPSAARMMR
jgi:MFS transporter, PPP family, 3-phenylpropionic acid transporter